MPLDPLVLVFLAAVGVAGGALGGLTGLGGGIVFAPALLAAFRWAGVDEAGVVPLVAGTSLLGTFFSVASGAQAQSRRKAVVWRVALIAGTCATGSLLATKALVTTQPWYTPRIFAVVFAAILVATAVRMLVSGREAEGEPRLSLPRVATTGTLAGILSAAAGVGGGVVLVPLFNRWLRLPLRTAAGTSNATIVLSSFAGAASFLMTPAPSVQLAGTVGSVSVLAGLVLGVFAVAGARGGVALAHRMPVETLRRLFAAVLAVLAVVLALG